MPASQCATEIVVDASFAAEVVQERVASRGLLRDVLKKLVDVSEICAIVRHCVLDEFSPALSVREPSISEAIEVFVLGLDSYNWALQKAAHGLLCDRYRWSDLVSPAQVFNCSDLPSSMTVFRLNFLPLDADVMTLTSASPPPTARLASC